MDNTILAYFLPNGVLDWFDVKKIERGDKKIRIELQEKNIVPEVPDEHQGKRIISKGFKKIVVDDFPIRGRKTELVFFRRVWQIEGVKEMLKRDIDLCVPGTNLEKEFADFLKELDRE